MLCVIGCGNATRSDDGVGVVVAQALQKKLRATPREGVRVFDAGTGGMDVMFHARGASRLILVDASISGSEPGAIFRVPGAELESLPEPGYSLHDFRWQHALAAGRKIFGGEFPREVTVYLIEAQGLDFGLELSAPVAAAALRVQHQIEAVIDGAAAPPAAPEEVVIARGNLYLSRELCDARLAGVASVALLVRDGRVVIVPLAGQSPGGLLLKQRNARGDRVVHAQEFFRAQGIAESFDEHRYAARWHAAVAALVVDGLAVEVAAG